MIVRKAKPSILICDDDETFQLGRRHLLKDKFAVKMARNTDEAKIILKKEPIDILLLDIEMRTPREGLDAIEDLQAIDEELMIVMSSGHTDLSYVREAMSKGAEDFIPKGTEPAEFILSLERVLKNKGRKKVVQSQSKEVKGTQDSYRLIGSSPKMVELRALIEKIKDKPVNVMIHGETGTGKEVVARQLRWTGEDGSLCPFVSVDSSTISGSLAESILFGHEKGAFTGADQTRKGIFEEANGGVVFLDEIGNMTLEIQSKLLRILQEKEVSRVGSTKVLPLEFRVVCATNRNLEDLVKLKLFKEDLFQRLNVIPVYLPPLRERKEDIPELVRHFVDKLGEAREFSDSAIEGLQRYDWPGNIRELQNVVAYVLTLSDESVIEDVDLPPQIRDFRPKPLGAEGASQETSSDTSFYEAVNEFEATFLNKKYAELGGNISQMAHKLKMDRSHLYKKLKQYEIHSPASKQA